MILISQSSIQCYITKNNGQFDRNDNVFLKKTSDEFRSTLAL